MADCGTIASSAITLAVERSLDLGVPMDVTLVMLKVLCERNLQASIEAEPPPHINQLAKLLNVDPVATKREAIKEMEKMANEMITKAATQVVLKGAG